MTDNARTIQQYNNPPFDINGSEYDYIISFFFKVMKDKVAAEHFAQSLYQISRSTQTPIHLLLEDLKNKNLMDLSSTMAYYLNGIRPRSTLLGVVNIAKPNYYAARNVAI